MLQVKHEKEVVMLTSASAVLIARISSVVSPSLALNLPLMLAACLVIALTSLAGSV
jgi:hypothetical protein